MASRQGRMMSAIATQPEQAFPLTLCLVLAKAEEIVRLILLQFSAAYLPFTE
jgi:hypothetical protein